MVSPIVLVVGFASVLILSVAGKPDERIEIPSNGSKKVISNVKAEDVPQLVKKLSEESGRGGSYSVSPVFLDLPNDSDYELIHHKFGKISCSMRVH